MNIKNTTAIVTGAASGLGAATAQALAAEGAHVFALDVNIDNAPAIDGVTYVTADVSDADDVRTAVSPSSCRGPHDERSSTAQGSAPRLESSAARAPTISISTPRSSE